MIQYRKQLFPVSYYKDNIKNNEKIKKEISPLILENSKLLKEKSPDGWLTNKIITSFSERNLANIFGKNTYFDKELRNEYAKCFNNFFDNYYKITADEIGYNCYINGEYQEAHDHLGDFFNPSAFSCVHFLSFNKDKHRPICFYDPIEQLRSTSLELASHNYQPDVFLDIKEGDFIMFPSFLKHSVFPSQPTPDYPRITISFNIVVDQYGANERKTPTADTVSLSFEGRASSCYDPHREIKNELYAPTTECQFRPTPS